MFDWTITLGNLLTVIGFFGATFGLVLSVKTDLSNLSTRLTILEKELSKLSEVLINLAIQAERTSTLETRVNRISDYLFASTARKANE